MCDTQLDSCVIPTLSNGGKKKNCVAYCSPGNTFSVQKKKPSTDKKTWKRLLPSKSSTAVVYDN